MIRQQSIFSHLLRYTLFSTLGFAVLLGLIAQAQIDRTLIVLRERSLEDRALDIASYLEQEEDGAVFLDLPAAELNFFAKAGKMHQYIIRGPDDQILFTSPVAFSERFPNKFVDDNPFFDFTGPLGNLYLGVSHQLDFGGTKYTVQVSQAEDIAEALPNLIADDFLRRLFFTSIPFFLLLVVAIYLSLRQSLKPLVLISDEAGRIRFSKPGIRLSEVGLPTELRPVVTAVNSALERLENGIKLQKEFTSNVAHELRTPLAVLKARIETLEDKKAVQDLSRDVEEMIRNVNQMLDLSKLDFPEAVGMEPTELAGIVKNVCQDMWPLFIAQKRQLKVSGIERRLVVNGNADLIYRAIRNLLDNALTYSPAGSTVDVRLDEAGEITVRDYGKTIAAEDRERIFRRFHRNDREKFRTGAGLGLSIVSKVMQIHNGSASLLAPDEGSGNIFSLQFSVLHKLNNYLTAGN